MDPQALWLDPKLLKIGVLVQYLCFDSAYQHAASGWHARLMPGHREMLLA